MPSRSLSALVLPVQMQALAMIAYCEQAGLEVLVYCTHRSIEEQARLFRNGRGLKAIEIKARELEYEYERPDLAELLLSTPPQFGKDVLTMAGPGQSLHNYRAAFDGVPLIDGKPQWGTRRKEDLDRWMALGEMGERVGLNWAGNWSENFREFPHFQGAGLDWRDRIQFEDFRAQWT